jgi:hypothetical protein
LEQRNVGVAIEEGAPRLVSASNVPGDHLHHDLDRLTTCSPAGSRGSLRQGKRAVNRVAGLVQHWFGLMLPLVAVRPR